MGEYESKMEKARIEFNAQNISYAVNTKRYPNILEFIEPQYLDFIKLRKRRDHFIFSIESIGQYPHVTDLFKEAIKVLKFKNQQLIEGIYTMQRREDEMIP